MDEAKKLATQMKLPLGDTFPKGVQNEQIETFQKHFDINFPLELVMWLRFTNGPCIGPSGIFGINTIRKNLDIGYYFGLYPDWAKKKFIPIAGDGCGNVYVILHGFSQDPIAFIDVAEDNKIPAFLVASDLWHFFCFYLLNWIGETGWPFDREKVLRFDPHLIDMSGAPKAWEVE